MAATTGAMLKGWKIYMNIVMFIVVMIMSLF